MDAVTLLLGIPGVTLTGALTTSGGGGGGGGAYATGAVAFDGDATLSNPALVATDGPQILWSYWYRVETNPVDVSEADYNPVWVSDPEDIYLYYSILEAADAGHPHTFVEFANGDETVQIRHDITDNSHQGAEGQWHNLLYQGDITGTPTGGVYLDDALLPLAISILGAGPDVSRLDGFSFYVGGDSYKNFVGALADVWIGVGQHLDLSIQANRRKFISATGKPVDLGATGATPTGTAPTIFLRAVPGSEAATFATNLGTGGAFAVTGALTAAPSSPSD